MAAKALRHEPVWVGVPTERCAPAVAGRKEGGEAGRSTGKRTTELCGLDETPGLVARRFIAGAVKGLGSFFRGTACRLSDWNRLN